ncbi:VCBS repeat-containing protein [Streptomyces bambusae]|uniref:FG-GAP repeat domain-containing protein n=1 Tax=Streptomyces bambusae TaxID=1550616 RepID=UPI001CFCBF6A|nr:VCBS repeat-containing protein [Streptomyces bambusae]MCB5168470.1 VCBS repeat-containing protein [Streptomyces bambusae]
MTFVLRGRAAKRVLVTTAAAVALAATAGTATAAGNPADAAAAAVRADAPRASFAAPAPGDVTAPTFTMWATDGMWLTFFDPDGKGGFQPRRDTAIDYSWAVSVAQADHDKDGISDGTWNRAKDGRMIYSSRAGGGAKEIGKGWQIYRKVISPGDLAGGKAADLLAVDKAGVLWLYTAYADGKVTARVKVGAGWGAMTEIAGQGDLTGDGRADIVARDSAGVLWLYPGTGNYKAPFGARKKVGAGWNGYNRILSIGDLDSDGVSDLVARTKGGDVYRYSGTGKAAAPFKKPAKIGFGFKNLNLL